jgi:hypothetical protein
MFALKKMITAAALTFAAMSAQAVPTLTFSAPAVTNGSSVSVDVNVSDITDLSTYSLSIGYDASLLSFSSISAGSFLGSGSDTDFFVLNTSATGMLDGIFGLTFADIGATGNGTLFTINFGTLAAGNAFLNFSNLLFLNSDADGLGDISVAAVNGAVSILPVVVPPGPGGDVPEPASALLLGVGAAAFLARRRRATTGRSAA